jgi:hypothetical protein
MRGEWGCGLGLGIEFCIVAASEMEAKALFEAGERRRPDTRPAWSEKRIWT